MKSVSLVDYLLLGMLALIWSTSFLLIKIAVHSVGPFTLTAVRLLIAALVLLTVLKVSGRSLSMTPAALRLYAVIGVLGHTVPFCLISLGEVYITSSMAAVLMGIMPISTFVLAHLFIPSEPMTQRKLLGVVLGFAGLLSLVGMSALGALGSHPAGQLAVLGGALCYSLSAVYTRTHNVAGGLEAAFSRNLSLSGLTEWGFVLKFRPSRHMEIMGGYRWFKYDYFTTDYDSGIIVELNGPFIGLNLPF